MNLELSTRNPKPETRNPKRSLLIQPFNSKLGTLHPSQPLKSNPYTLTLTPSIFTPQFLNSNPEPPPQVWGGCAGKKQSPLNVERAYWAAFWGSG